MEQGVHVTDERVELERDAPGIKEGMTDEEIKEFDNVEHPPVVRAVWEGVIAFPTQEKMFEFRDRFTLENISHFAAFAGPAIPIDEGILICRVTWTLLRSDDLAEHQQSADYKANVRNANIYMAAKRAYDVAKRTQAILQLVSEISVPEGKIVYDKRSGIPRFLQIVEAQPSSPGMVPMRLTLWPSADLYSFKPRRNFQNEMLRRVRDILSLPKSINITFVTTNLEKQDLGPTKSEMKLFGLEGPQKTVILRFEVAADQAKEILSNQGALFPYISNGGLVMAHDDLWLDLFTNAVLDSIDNIDQRGKNYPQAAITGCKAALIHLAERASALLDGKLFQDATITRHVDEVVPDLGEEYRNGVDLDILLAGGEGAAQTKAVAVPLTGEDDLPMATSLEKAPAPIHESERAAARREREQERDRLASELESSKKRENYFKEKIYERQKQVRNLGPLEVEHPGTFLAVLFRQKEENSLGKITITETLSHTSAVVTITVNDEEVAQNRGRRKNRTHTLLNTLKAAIEKYPNPTPTDADVRTGNTKLNLMIREVYRQEIDRTIPRKANTHMVADKLLGGKRKEPEGEQKGGKGKAKQAKGGKSEAQPPMPVGQPPMPAGQPPMPMGQPPMPMGQAPMPMGQPPMPMGQPPMPAGRPPMPGQPPYGQQGQPRMPFGQPPPPLGHPSMQGMPYQNQQQMMAQQLLQMQMQQRGGGQSMAQQIFQAQLQKQQQQMQMQQQQMQQQPWNPQAEAWFSGVLRELTGAGKPVIERMTAMAMQQQMHAREILCALEKRIRDPSLGAKESLAAWYLYDSLIKSNGGRNPFVTASLPTIEQLVNNFLPSRRDPNLIHRCQQLVATWEQLYPPHLFPRLMACIR
eukprot:TRINITY_DN1292_c0_g1_i1.p1 TRINITY_DN1292_c0_g1~~TRINITY_DN1292_c0_g1_i1.p1  ORF type:complete len:942 (+),score=274.43 TRINITY_DN1292_c0_g1_i1:228-2828(+)